MELLELLISGGYLKHLRRNHLVALRSFMLTIFYFLHGLFPCKLTSYHHWREWLLRRM